MSQLNEYEIESLENYYDKPIDEITDQELQEFCEMAEAQMELREEDYQLECALNGQLD